MKKSLMFLPACSLLCSAHTTNSAAKKSHHVDSSYPHVQYLVFQQTYWHSGGPRQLHNVGADDTNDGGMPPWPFLQTWWSQMQRGFLRQLISCFCLVRRILLRFFWYAPINLPFCTCHRPSWEPSESWRQYELRGSKWEGLRKGGKSMLDAWLLAAKLLKTLGEHSLD